MTVAVTLDKSLGMTFLSRRLSRDRKQREHLLSLSEKEGKRLLISPFSQKLFEDTDAIVENDPLEIAKENDICFIEDLPLMPYREKISRMIVYWWNRDYPSSQKLDIDLKKGWKKLSCEDIAGSSHDKITVEVYINEKL